ncbi:MAG: nitrilase-related carbon-nitrogen hydrolase [Candidatus Bathyarchaeia archaeon]
MRVGYVQFRPLFGKKEKNLNRILKFLEEGARREADLLVFPELCNTGYVFKSKKEVEVLSENVTDGQTTRALTEATEDMNLYIVAGLCEKKDEQFFNSAILIGPNGLVAVYRKTHLFNEEKIWFTEGDTPFQVYDISKARIGIMICFDWFFPEVMRILALKGAQIVCHPANLVLPYCQTALLGAAVQNRIFIITANRVGVERGIKFTGRSQIVSPKMEILARSLKTNEEIQLVEISPKEADSKRVTDFNDLWVDRRVDLYQSLLELEK